MLPELKYSKLWWEELDLEMSEKMRSRTNFFWEKRRKADVWVVCGLVREEQ